MKRCLRAPVGHRSFLVLLLLALLTGCAAPSISRGDSEREERSQQSATSPTAPSAPLEEGGGEKSSEEPAASPTSHSDGPLRNSNGSARDKDEQAVPPRLLAALERVEAEAEYETSTQQDNLFNNLFGREVATQELLRVNGEPVTVYVFEDAERAAEAAESLEPGGASFTYTRPDGTTVRETLDVDTVWTLPWWHVERFLLTLPNPYPPGSDMVGFLSYALETEPLYDADTPGAESQLRIDNLSAVDFDSVTLQTGSQSVEYGAIPATTQSAYRTVDDPRVAGLQVEAGGESYGWLLVDESEDPPLRPGRYTYVIDIVGRATDEALLPDDETFIDRALLGEWYWVAARPTPRATLFPTTTGEWPYLRFTEEPDPNEPDLHLEGYTGCNRMDAPYRLAVPGRYDHSGRMVVYGILTTAVGCPEPVDESEEFLVDALRHINRYSVEGEYLFLFTNRGLLTFMRFVPTTPPPYARWEVASLAPVLQALRGPLGPIDPPWPSEQDNPFNQWAGAPISTRWETALFDDAPLTVYVFDDDSAAAAAANALREHPEQFGAPALYWLNGRFIIADYDSEQALKADLIWVFGAPLGLSEEGIGGTPTASFRPSTG